MRIRKKVLQKIISIFASVLLLVNSFSPFLLIAPKVSSVSAQEVTVTPTSAAEVLTEEASTVAPTLTETLTPTVEPTIAPTETPTPTIEITMTPEPTIEATSSATPTIDPTPTTASASFSEAKIPLRKAGNLLKEIKKQAKKNYVEGEVIVKFKKNKLNVKGLLGKAKAFVFEKKFSLEKRDEIKASNIQVFKSKKSTEEMVKELKVDSNVEYAEPNYIRELSTIPSADDISKDLLWGLDNIGQTVEGTYSVHTGNSPYDQDIDAPEAWATSEGSPNVIVAVIDTGVAYNHPDLAVNMWNGTNCKDDTGTLIEGGCNHGYDFESGDNTPLPDNSSHGTHVAGTIAAAKNNSKGIIGVAPKAKIMALKIGFDASWDTIKEAKAIDFAIQNGAKVINASYGGTGSSTTEYDAINRFRTAGGIFVAAAGNNSSNNESTPNYPSDYNLDNIISVAATDQNDSLASFSNYGATSVDVGAPGTNIYSTEPFREFDENFENVNVPLIGSKFTQSGNNTWGTKSDISNTNKAIFGDYAHWGQYQDNIDSWIDSQTLNLDGKQNSYLTFDLSCNTEPGLDGIILYFFNGSTWEVINSYSGDGSDTFVYLLQDYVNANFKFSFEWISNASNNNYDGCYIDNIIINDGSSSNEQYQYMNGTSMAAPHVAGLVALIEGYNPSLNAEQVKDKILTTGDSISALSGKTVSGKRINAYNALVAAAPSSTPTPTPSPTSTPTPTPTPPNYATIFGDVKTTLLSQGITTNIDTFASTPTDCTGLYFEKTGYGRVTFNSSLNLTDSTTNAFLQTLGTKMDANAGSISFDASTAEQLRTAGAEIKMYGFSHGEDTDPITQTELVVKNDSGTIINPSDVVNYPDITGFTWDNVNGAVTFSASHFTQFYLNDTIKPSITSFSVPSTSTSLTVNGITVTAHDNRGVSNYAFTESETKPLPGADVWSSAGATSYTHIFDSPGPKTLYAWAKDAADNVSNLYSPGQTVTITLAPPPNNAPSFDSIVNKSIDEDSSSQEIPITNISAGSGEDSQTVTMSATSSDTNIIPSPTVTGTGATRTLSYTTVANAYGTATITVLANDGQTSNNTYSQSFNITVNPVNDGPSFDPIADQVVDEDSSLQSISITNIKSGPDNESGQTVTMTATSNNVSVIPNPTVSAVSGGTANLTYTPAANKYGSATITVVANDGQASSNTFPRTFIITVNSVNDKPIANAQSVTTEEDHALLITLTGSDVDGDSLTYSKTSDPTHGSISFSGNKVTYTPSSNYNGPDSFTFKVNDSVLDSDSATVSITITAVNEPPVLDPIGNKTIDELTNLTFTAHATDPDNTVTYSLTNAPTGATINSSTGVFSFTPTEAQGPETHTLTVNAGDGTNTDSEVITITVDEINAAPFANNISASTNEDTEKIITLTATDSDLPENTLIFTIVTDSSHGTVYILDNQATYTPIANYSGSDSFTYKVNDGTIDSNIATVTMTVTAVNDMPEVNDDSVITNEDIPVEITFSGSDIEKDVLTYSIIPGFVNGTFSTIVGNKVTYTPDPNYNGSDSFYFKANDGTDDSAFGTITITINSINDSPVANPDSASVNEDTILTITKSTLLANDTDVEGSSLNLTAVSNPVNGSVVIDGTNVKFTPTNNYFGSASFDYTVSDGTLTNTTTVTITVNPVNDKPVAFDDTASVNEDTDLSIAKLTLLGNDSDIEDDQLSITAVSNAVNGSVSIVGNNIIFTPTSNYFGSASFDYIVSDASLSDTATVTITVNSVNDKPVAANGSVSTGENVAKNITLSATDIDLPAQTLTYSIVSGPLHGTLSTISENHTTYTPATDYLGTDSFTFKANDGTDDSNVATINITINDTTAPTVTKLGDGSVDYSLPSLGDGRFGVTLIFSEELGTASKTAVENALNIGSDKTLTFKWGTGDIINKLRISVIDTVTATFANDVVVNVSDVAGNITNSLLLVDSSLTATQTSPDDDTGEVTADSDTPEVVITDPNDEVTVAIDGSTDATIDVSAFITDGEGDIPKITINSDSADVSIPATKVTGPTGWDGVIAAPTVTTVDLPETSGETKTLSAGIELGFADGKLSFDNAVRIVLPGQAGKRAGYSRPETAFTEITTTCGENSQTWADNNLGVDGECKIDVGLDLVIWTKHFTKFAAYTQTTNSTSGSSSSSSSGATVAGASAPVCNDQKPGNAPFGLTAVAGLNSVTLTWNKASDPVSYYLMTFGTSPGSQTYGNPNIGNSDTTSYTVSGLSGGTTYYFKVRAGNGCMPGDFSNEASSSPSGGFIEGVPAGFEAGVLGEATKSAELNEEDPTPTTTVINAGLVKGIESIAKNKSFKYIFPVVLLILLTAVIFYFYKKRNS